MAKGAGGTRFEKLSSNSSVYKTTAKNTVSTPKTAETKIRQIISDFERQGYSSIQPFSIGAVETRMKSFAEKNNITLGSDEMYMTSKQIGHSIREFKVDKGIAVSPDELVNFVNNKSLMDLFYDKVDNAFVYTNRNNKFIVRPNYRLSINRKKQKVVNYITATKMLDNKEFLLPKYIRI